MKKYFSQLRPLERRLAVGVLVILFLVLNGVFIWPHFSDWGRLQQPAGCRAEEIKTLPDRERPGTGLCREGKNPAKR